jgi:hypothetical protein
VHAVTHATPNTYIQLDPRDVLVPGGSAGTMQHFAGAVAPIVARQLALAGYAGTVQLRDARSWVWVKNLAQLGLIAIAVLIAATPESGILVTAIGDPRDVQPHATAPLMPATSGEGELSWLPPGSRLPEPFRLTVT